LGQDGLGASEVHDHVLALEALHDSRHDFLLAILELVENLFALGVANMLDEILLGRLRRDSAHRGSVELDQNFVADFRLGIVFGTRLGHVGLSRRIGDLLDNSLYLEQLDFAEFRIEPRLDIAVRPERAPRRRMHHLLDRVDHDRFVDAFFLGDLLDYPVQIDLHTASPGRGPNGAPANFVAPPGREPVRLFVKVVFVIRSRHLVETNRMALAAGLVVKLDSALPDRYQPSRERLLPIARAMRSYLHPLALDRLEMLQLAQRPVASPQG